MNEKGGMMGSRMSGFPAEEWAYIMFIKATIIYAYV